MAAKGGRFTSERLKKKNKRDATHKPRMEGSSGADPLCERIARSLTLVIFLDL